MKIGILFDLDGTLTDSGLGITKAVQYALGQMGYEVPPREALFSFIGPPLHKSFQKHYGMDEDTSREAVRQFRVYYNQMGGILENEVYDGVRELLRDLKAAGKRLMIATSKPEQMSVDILEHFGLAKYFDRICGATMDTSRSSKEDVIAYLLQQVDAKENAIMVGDTVYDVTGAAHHGIPTIGVAWG